MKFYDCKPAPSPRLVRMFIAEKGLDIETVEIDLRSGAHLKPEFKLVSPYGTVPVLETDSGLRLTSTQGCWRYLEALRPEPNLLGATPDEQGRIADRVWRIDIDGFYALADAIRNSMEGFKNRAVAGPINYDQIPALAERGKLRARHFVETFEAQILGNRDYIAGDRFTAADIMGFVVIEFAGWIKIELPESARRARDWLSRIKSRPSAAL